MSWFIRIFKGGIRSLKNHGFMYTLKLFLKKIRNKGKQILKIVMDKGPLKVFILHTYIQDPKYSKVKYIYFLGKQIYPGNRCIYSNTWVDNNQPAIYFKVNCLEDFVRPCIQHWVNIAHDLKSDFYFICDNKQLEYYILNTVRFWGSDVKFVPSYRARLQKICATLSDPSWQNATYAHLTPFYHAKDNKISQFWAIDADDTMMCLSHMRVAEIMKTVQTTARENHISAISLDMWRSRTLGRHWSWGIAFVSEGTDFCALFSENKNLSWTEPYKNIEHRFNLDWFFTYLKDHGKYKIETFYIEDMYFIHWGNFLRNPLARSICLWRKGKLIFPIMEFVFGDKKLGEVNIADCLKIDVSLRKDESIRFLRNDVAVIKKLPIQIKNLNNALSFGE